MAFYDLSKEERNALVQKIGTELTVAIQASANQSLLTYFTDDDTYIRKTAYLAIGRIYFETPTLRQKIIGTLNDLMEHENFKVRQTTINAAGEIGKSHFHAVQHFFDRGLFDSHHSPRNAVIGSVKKMGEVNPEQILPWAENYIQHPDKEIRREICHGIELRGRRFPADILPLLKRLEFDPTARVRNTLVHVLGQISYKKGCLPIVLNHLQKWDNSKLIADALNEIIHVHHRYRQFAAMTQEDAKYLIDKTFSNI